jgi:hypothetical protein
LPYARPRPGPRAQVEARQDRWAVVALIWLVVALLVLPYEARVPVEILVGDLAPAFAAV